MQDEAFYPISKLGRKTRTTLLSQCGLTGILGSGIALSRPMSLIIHDQLVNSRTKSPMAKKVAVFRFRR